MNERIKELAEQADITLVPTEFTGCLSGQDFLVTDRNITGRHLEEFAELIVRECASHLNWVGDDAAGIELLEHFGVKE